MNYYMNLAIKCAKANKIQKLPKLAAVLVTKNKTVFIGFNRYKTHPLQKKFSRNSSSLCLHAEMDAIVQASRAKVDIEGGAIYVARVNKKMQPALAKPCEGCERALVHFGIKIVEWTENAKSMDH